LDVTRRGLFLFAAMCLIWGVPYLLIRVAVDEISPALLVLLRTGIAALLLLPLAAMRDELRPLRPLWVPVLAFAAIEIAIPWVLLGAAEQHVSSSLAALVIAGVPLVGAVIAATTGTRDRLEPVNLAGLLVGLAGVALIVGVNVGGGIVPLLELGAVAVCYAVGPAILQRWLAGAPALGVIAASLAVTAVAYVPIAAFSLPSALPSAEATASVLALAVVCTAVAFVAFFALIAEIGPVRATVITYVNPAVAAVLGILVLDERLTGWMVGGFALVLVGSVLATRAARPALEPLADGV
jgi:drug/metabolite transporter (DMT)-like permease